MFYDVTNVQQLCFLKMDPFIHLEDVLVQTLDHDNIILINYRLPQASPEIHDRSLGSGIRRTRSQKGHNELPVYISRAYKTCRETKWS